MPKSRTRPQVPYSDRSRFPEMRADLRMYALRASPQGGGCAACASAGFLCAPGQAQRVPARKAKSYQNRQKSLCILSHFWSLHKRPPPTIARSGHLSHLHPTAVKNLPWTRTFRPTLSRIGRSETLIGSNLAPNSQEIVCGRLTHSRAAPAVERCSLAIGRGQSAGV
jgi:hypothetical protein